MTSTPPRTASHSAVNLDQIRRGKAVVVWARHGDGGAANKSGGRGSVVARGEEKYINPPADTTVLSIPTPRRT